MVLFLVIIFKVKMDRMSVVLNIGHSSVVYLMVDISLDVAMTTELLYILFASHKMLDMRKN